MVRFSEEHKEKTTATTTRKHNLLVSRLLSVRCSVYIEGFIEEVGFFIIIIKALK